jgi:hypothetical protein
LNRRKIGASTCVRTCFQLLPCALEFAAVDSELLSERDLEADYHLPIPWLRRARRERKGPPFLRLGKLVRYRRADVETFLASRVVRTGDEPQTVID